MSVVRERLPPLIKLRRSGIEMTAIFPKQQNV
jgi:hypothetical protein